MNKKANETKVKVGKLKVNKETVKDLDDKEAKGVKGGYSGGCYDGVQANKPVARATANCDG